MTTIKVSASGNYEVQIGPGLLPQIGEKAKALFPKAQKAFVVTDSTVAPLYLERVAASLEKSGFTALSFAFPAGEASKNGETYLALLECLAAERLTRSDLLIALGGGVVGDMGGFVAATYLRGISYIQVPTTLLAAVDSSVGGKTAIDLIAGKNLAGAFYQPGLVLCDTDTLETLPEEIYFDGYAEVIKYGMLGSNDLLEALKAGPQAADIESVIARCVTMKRDIVERDEFDRGDRQLLNLGHTVGHAIERCSEFGISHGRAVAMGMTILTRAAVKKGLCPADCLTVLESLLPLYHLPQETTYSAEALYDAALGDKKRSGSTMTIVVPQGLGSCGLLQIKVEDLLDWIEKGLKQ